MWQPQKHVFSVKAVDSLQEARLSYSAAWETILNTMLLIIIDYNSAIRINSQTLAYCLGKSLLIQAVISGAQLIL